MKKFVLVLLSFVLVFCLAACGNGNQNSTEPSAQPENGNSPEVNTTPENSADLTKPAAGKILVVYYSASGNTEAVAKTIADAAGGGLFELVPAAPYTTADLNWRNQNSRVSREHNDTSLRAVELKNAVPDNWSNYDTIFVGYPVWWGIAAWPVDGFISANDFTGKTVIPFCTSTSSGLGESGELLAKAAGKGNWLTGHRFSEHPADSDVKEWVKELGF